MSAWHGVLEELIRQRRSALVGYAYLLAGDRPLAEDLVHDAIIRTFSRARRLENVGAAEGYVRRAILTLFLNNRRSRSRALAKQHLLVVPDVAPPDDAAGDHDVVVCALNGLAPRQRACVVLRYFEDLSTAETAERLGLSEGSVKRYVHDAMVHMRGELGDIDPGPEPTPQSVVLVKGGAR
ncbi:SigE family RNA polymerase sigma factor [Demequina sp. NBRC 110051]|uniref:SigE family RNA polymerase sigma factor n=1 Tax=Demequina sp. NBRC 110051 TaxID=1570340 RepID=UPI000A01AC18|nr:SigE family RNA polymerase sigma factor [Demequina sp. NBRC 110051]